MIAAALAVAGIAQAIDGHFGTATTRIGSVVFEPDDDGTVPTPSTLALLAAALAARSRSAD